jgi:serine/threonine protein kinase/cold shock CspA family protein
MGPRTDRRSKRSFVYVSDAKLARLLRNIDNGSRPGILGKIQVTLGLNFGLVNLAVQSQSTGGRVSDRVRAAQVAMVEDHIREKFLVGDLAVGQDWIAGRADMRLGVLQDGRTALFCGYAGPLLVALKGSLVHVIGQSAVGNWDGSYPVVKLAVLNDESGSPGDQLAAAARTMGFEPQAVRFLAQVIRRGTLTGDGPQCEFVEATPLYVEEARHAGEIEDTPIQGTVQWFSADRGWGLITRDGYPDAVVVEASAVPTGVGHGLRAGQRVEFRITHGAAGILATSVRLLQPWAGAQDASSLSVTSGKSRRPGDPQWIDRYEILGLLGEGSMGVVYLARGNEGDEGFVAIKVMRPEHARDPVFLRRFRDEADNARRVRSPNVARVLGAVTDTGHPYLVTEFIVGPTLQQQVEQHGHLPEQSAIDVSAGVAAALDAIHKAGIVHRDLKPSNVILSAAGPKVIDFGLARASGQDIQYTQYGMPIGTPAYMSPEQINQATLTTASDIFSWAGLTVFAVTGHQPFGVKDSAWSEVWREISDGTPNLTGVPARLRGVITAALSKTPVRRPTAAQLLKRLPPSPPPGQSARRPRSRRPVAGRLLRERARLAAGGVVLAVVVAVAALLAVVLSPSSPTRTASSPSSKHTMSPRPTSQTASAAEPASPGTKIGVLSDPGGYGAEAVAFSPDGNTLAGTFENNNESAGHVDLWNVASLRLAGPLTDPGGGNSVEGVAFSPKNADSLAVADQNGVDLWNLATKSPSNYADPDNEWIEDLAYTSDGKTIAEVDGMGYIYLLNVADGQWSAKNFKDPADAPSNAVNPMQVAVGSTGELAVADNAGNVYVWNLSGGAPAVLHGATTAGGYVAQDLAFSPDGKTLALADSSNIRLWNVVTHASTFLAGPDTSPQALAFTPDGTTLAVADGDGSIYLWDIATRKETAISSPITSWGGLAFGPDGKTLAAFGYDATSIYLYRINYS